MNTDTNAANLLSEHVCVLILQMHRQCQTGAKRQIEGIIRSHCRHSVDISHFDIQHDHLIAKRSSLFDQKRDLAILVESLDSFVIDKLNDWAGALLIFVALS